AKAAYARRRQTLSKKREDGKTIRNGRLKHETLSLTLRQTFQLFESVNYRPFVSRDDVRAVFERSAYVLDSGFSRLWVERSGFEQNIRACRSQPLSNIRRQRRSARCRFTFQKCLYIKTIRINEPAHAPRGRAREAPLYAVLRAHLFPLCDKKPAEPTH